MTADDFHIFRFEVSEIFTNILLNYLRTSVKKFTNSAYFPESPRTITKEFLKSLVHILIVSGSSMKLYEEICDKLSNPQCFRKPNKRLATFRNSVVTAIDSFLNISNQ